MQRSHRVRRVLLWSSALLLGAHVSAQGATRRVLTLDEAKAVGAAAAAEARSNHEGGAIAVVDEGGALLYLERLDGTFAAAASVATAKARTAATFRRPTADFENAIRGGRTPLLGVAEMTPLEGGVPILLEGEVVGAIGVSGATNADRDEAIARAAATALERAAAKR